ncbi:MAG: AAA family ATPase [bacterium]|nr:AAA family ATPase [bacterium]
MSRARIACALLLIALAACEGSGEGRFDWQSLESNLDPRVWLGVQERWQRVYPEFTAPVRALLRDSDDEQFIYAACSWQAVDQGVGGVLRSTDEGKTWLAANRDIPPGTEVTALAVAPAGFAAPETALLAGTRGAGIYVSLTGGLKWRLLTTGDGDIEQATVNAFVTFPGNRPAVAVATEESGVLLSVDGGISWRARNRGLPEPSVAALVIDAEGDLVAATAAGVYSSGDRGRRWALLDEQLVGTRVTALMVDARGTLWAGSRDGSLLALTAGASSFQPQQAPTIEGAEVLMIAERPGGVVVGTRGSGAVEGALDQDFVGDDSGLENRVVTAVLAARDQPGEVIIGTAAGFYRSAPVTPSPFPVEIAAVVAAVLLLLGFVGWRRSARAAARSLQRALSPLDPDGLREVLNHRIARLEPERGQAILKRLAARLSRSRGDLHGELAPVVAATADLCGRLKGVDAAARGAPRRAIAAALDTRASALEFMAGYHGSGGGGVDAAATSLAQQDELFAVLLRAESLGHLAALRSDAHEVERRAGSPTAGRLLDREFLRDVRRVLGALEELSRMPSAEDRALYVGQALTQTLAAQARLEARLSRQPAFDLKIGTVVLESVRELLATSFDDIQQRAELQVELHSKVLTTRREAVVVLGVRNVGQGHARNVTLELDLDQRAFRAAQSRQEIKSLLRNQTARVEFLVEPLVSDRVRLSFSITYDDHERSGQKRQFADVVQFQQITERRAFRPLQPNPYVVGRPLMDSDVFIGRQKVFERISSNMQGANQDNVVVLMGQRRMGKTSILRRLDRHLGGGYAPVLIDLQGFLGSGEPAFFRELVATIHDELEENGVEVDEPAPADFDTDPGTVFRRRYLGAVRRALGDRRLLLAFDEFEVLQERIEAGDLDRRILPFFRSLMQHQKNVSFMFAGTHRLDELTGDYWSVLFNLAIYLDVGHLSPDDVSELFTGPTKDSFEIDPLALDKIYRTTGGHPHFSQLLARELAEFCNRQQLAYVTVQDVNRVAEKVAEKGQLHIGYLWDEGSRAERLLLLALKELLDREGVATLRAAHGFLTERRIEAGDLQAAAHQLLRKEILSENAGKLSFRMDLLRLWMDQRHDLETFALSDASGWWRL